jgi:nucleoid DNA-binding protein
MKRSELAEEISKETGFPTYKVNQILKSFVDKVGDELSQNGEVILRGLGVFKIKLHKCPEDKIRKVIKFTAYNKLKIKVNQIIK